MLHHDLLAGCGGLWPPIILNVRTKGHIRTKGHNIRTKGHLLSLARKFALAAVLGHVATPKCFKT